MLKLLLKYHKGGPFFPQKEKKRKKPPLNQQHQNPEFGHTQGEIQKYKRQ
jgi:hypothetical protein